MLCCIWWCVISGPTTTSTPHSGQFITLRCLSQNIGPVPIIRLLYVSTDMLPDVWQGWQAVLTVFRVFLRSWPGQIGLWGLRTPSEASTVGLRRQVHLWHNFFRHVPYKQVKPLHDLLSCLHHRHPVADDGVHYHVEERGIQGLSLCHSVVNFEREDKVSVSPGHHGQMVKVCPNELEHPGAILTTCKFLLYFHLVITMTRYLSTNLLNVPLSHFGPTVTVHSQILFY